MAFRFQLEKFWKIYQAREDLKKREVATVLNNIRLLEEFKQKNARQLSEAVSQSLEVGKSEWTPFWTDKAVSQLETERRVDERLARERELLVRKQKELEGYVRRRKALEALRDKRRVEFHRLERRRDQKQLDEVYRNRRDDTKDKYEKP